MSLSDPDSSAATPAIQVENLRFAYSAIAQPDPAPVLEHVDLTLPKGSRCILVGANGAAPSSFDTSFTFTLTGKSTLLQILAGKRLTRSGAKVMGEDVFFSTPKGVTYLGTEWAANPVVRSDLVVSHFLDSVGGYKHKERRDRLLDILDVDLNWHMHQVSDGERRRVQIVSGLMAPWDVLLLDEVTVDLDVLVRSRLLSFLIEETTNRSATLLYATHIFDGLDAFPTHLCHIQLGSTVPPSPLAWPLPSLSSANADGHDDHGVALEVRQRMDDPERNGSKMLELALYWLQQDKEKRVEKEKKEGKVGRGAGQQGIPSESETFYRKYDYSH